MDSQKYLEIRLIGYTVDSVSFGDGYGWAYNCSVRASLDILFLLLEEIEYEDEIKNEIEEEIKEEIKNEIKV